MRPEPDPRSDEELMAAALRGLRYTVAMPGGPTHTNQTPAEAAALSRQGGVVFPQGVCS